jgi:predicted nucleic acid-binding protein
VTDPAFFDASALVPFCLYEATSQRVRSYLHRHTPVVWWASRIEICSAVARLLRFGDIDTKEAGRALGHLETMSRVWSEICPDESVRDLACQLVTMYPLRAGDCQQLAAALIWCRQRPRGRTFICGDKRLSDAAKTAGFSVIDL